MNSITRKPIRHAKLRGLMHEKGLTQIDLRDVIDRGESYVTDRMCGRKSWTITEAYAIADWLWIPSNQMHLYFPLGGVS